ncbi:hypothetical protein GIB67_028050 [Kingdonia uniflora]|uniref:Uncharacterized protein n=1 Tax=Kingdonia uniflora TaxID=39325 RepID=A0A7J7L144_9MAGN|nr:hypothetical protein GIB67_028050 [Kingdonia uniflora]
MVLKSYSSLSPPPRKFNSSSLPIHSHQSTLKLFSPSFLTKISQSLSLTHTMEAKIGKLLDSVSSFFSGSDQIPWCVRDIVLKG